MFTGIIEEIGTVVSLARLADSCRITVAASKVLTDVHLGDSIATNGICLTVVHFDAHSFAADVMPETLSLTNLGLLRPRDRVNLERALPVNGRLGGHIVSGHVDGTGLVVKNYRDHGAIRVRISSSPDILGLIVRKGSITIDGISLTVTDVDESSFGVSLVEHTQGETTLASKPVGSRVNLENDILAKYVQRLMGLTAAPSVDQSLLELLK